jgi:uncharacterized membrane protein YtjA (UPF0391 family)
MLYYALVFFIVAVISGLLGFRGLESAASKIAKVFFYVFLMMALVVVVGALLGASAFF